MQFNTLPDKLIECALWCVWKYEDRDGKPTKVPYNPRTGGRAQSNNPATFSDFKTAVAAFGTCKYDGMGIADTDTMHIQVVHDVLIVTFKDSGDTVYIKLSNKRF